jgi:hypothetical protein
MKSSLSDCREVDMQKRLGPFFVTGLPRSRTAWIANLLTTDTTICYHDVPFSIGAVGGGKVIGFAGPQTCTQFTDVTRFFPSAPWLIVLRDRDEALRSLKKFTPVPDDYWNDRCHLISALCAKHQAMTVNFDELDNEEVVRGAWAHLLPGIPFDVERFNLLCTMNIQQQLPNDLTTPAIR